MVWRVPSPGDGEQVGPCFGERDRSERVPELVDVEPLDLAAAVLVGLRKGVPVRWSLAKRSPTGWPGSRGAGNSQSSLALSAMSSPSSGSSTAVTSTTRRPQPALRQSSPSPQCTAPAVFGAAGHDPCEIRATQTSTRRRTST